MAKRYKINGVQGYQEIVTPENSDLKKIHFGIMKGGAGEKVKGDTNGKESVFVITEGHVRFLLQDKVFAEMSRKNVFDEPPAAVYLPPYTQYSVEFSKNSEICIAGSPAKGTGKPSFIKPGDIRIKRAGKEPFLRNMAAIVPEEFPAENIIIGETITDPGNWSSYPPHKHDTQNPPEETALEELYFFKITPKTGFGTIRIFDDSEDNLFLVRNNEAVTIPKGYHPVAVAPGHRFYYLWILTGDSREIIPFVHPDYRFNGL